MVSVRFFAAAAQAAGRRQVEGNWAGLTAAQLVTQLQTDFPGLQKLGDTAAVAVNHEYVDRSHVLVEGDEVALIPPVSGGADAGASPSAQDAASGGAAAFAVVSTPIVTDDVVAKVVDPTIGAIVTFVGTVREWTRGKRTVLLEYEAYPEMALVQMGRIAAEVGQQWPGSRVAITHRVGRLDIGAVSVVIAVGTPHRADGFAACRHAIERLKQVVPVWKKEVWADGEEWVGSQDGPDWMHPELR